MSDERRNAGDRRRQPTRWPSRHWLRGRRRGGRRESERRGVHVDRHTPVEWTAVVALMLLCLADLLLTLDILEQGGEEANPVMRWALDLGTGTFVVLKMGLTALGAVVLLARARFRVPRAALGVLLLLYVALLGYHMVLRGQLVPVTPVVLP